MPSFLRRQLEAAIGLRNRVASCFRDYRKPDYAVHSLCTLLGQRIAAIALCYEDVNDHDALGS